ncbi:hypothetical protein ABEB36_002985 [Hypothenemus hampei]|uniref:Farnesol dehydrogenase-like n=1 Tax=Hypothenemus hampei TaxID=57062 RepID=A0ABD1F7M5_HYPHA
MVLSIKRFEGKVAVVTGASSGIGAAISEELVKNGIIVAGLARRTEKVEELSKNLSGKKGKLHAFKCDLTKEEDIVSVFEEIKNKLGPINILVNNAGLSQKGSLIDGDTKAWKTVLDTNILGLCIATREAVQDMKTNNTKGHIIHINSVLGHQVIDYAGLNVYGPSKYAVTALAQTLRFDINREKLPIKITSVSPGYVKTEFQQVAGLETLPPAVPGLAGEDVADAVIYTLSTPPSVNISVGNIDKRINIRELLIYLLFRDSRSIKPLFLI